MFVAFLKKQKTLASSVFESFSNKFYSFSKKATVIPFLLSQFISINLSIYLCGRVGSSFRIHRLHLCRKVRPSNECPEYDTKQSDGEASAMLKFWNMKDTSSLLSLPASLWPGVVAPDRVLSIK